MSMPMLFAASQMVVPSGTVTSWPSMVRRMRRGAFVVSVGCTPALSFMRAFYQGARDAALGEGALKAMRSASERASRALRESAVKR